MIISSIRRKILLVPAQIRMSLQQHSESGGSAGKKKKKSLRSKLTRFAKGGSPRGVNSALWRILLLVFFLSLLIPNLFHFASYRPARSSRKKLPGGETNPMDEGERNKRKFQVIIDIFPLSSVSLDVIFFYRS